MERPVLAFDVGSSTNPGKVRQRNEDSLLLRTDAGFWAIADGMGGHDAGDVASQLIVAALNKISSPSTAADLLEQCEERIFAANRQIIEISKKNGGLTMGSTVAVLLVREEHYACVWAGDSRVYLVRDESIVQISRDHTEVEELRASGAVSAEELKHWPKNVITRAVGVREQPELEIVTGPCMVGDAFVLCSDGLTNHVEDQEICECVSGSGAKVCSDALVQLALDRGGLDNVTVVVVKSRDSHSPPASDSSTSDYHSSPPVGDEDWS
jgi:serine/threonine protein phosphatase PrpC